MPIITCCCCLPLDAASPLNLLKALQGWVSWRVAAAPAREVGISGKHSQQQHQPRQRHATHPPQRSRSRPPPTSGWAASSTHASPCRWEGHGCQGGEGGQRGPIHGGHMWSPLPVSRACGGFEPSLRPLPGSLFLLLLQLLAAQCVAAWVRQITSPPPSPSSLPLPPAAAAACQW